MTVGTTDYNLDTFGIKYVKKDKPVDQWTEGNTKPTGSTPSTTKLPTSGADAPKDKLDLAASSTTSNLTNPSEHQQGKVTTYGEGSTGTQGDKPNTGDRAITDGIGGTKKNPNSDKQGNKVNFKKPEGQALPKNASLDLAIIKCKLLKLKAHNFSPDDKQSDFQESKADSSDLLRVDTPRRTSTGEVSSNQSGDIQQEVGRADTQEDRKTKTTGDKIPHEKLGDLPQGKDNKEVGGTEIEDKDGKSRKLESPADRYKSEVREMAIDAIDMAMKTIAVYQDAKEKAIQEELIKEAYEAQLKADGGITTSDGVNAVYSDVHQKKINKEE